MFREVTFPENFFKKQCLDFCLKMAYVVSLQSPVRDICSLYTSICILLILQLKEKWQLSAESVKEKDPITLWMQCNMVKSQVNPNM